MFSKGHVVPLREVLHANDAKIYNRLVNGKTVAEEYEVAMMHDAALLWPHSKN